VDGASLSAEALWKGPHWGAPSLESLEDRLRKSPDMGNSLHGGPFYPRGTWYVGGSYTGDFDRRMKEGSSGGISLCEGFHEGDLEGGPL
jgi:hypothetical protein